MKPAPRSKRVRCTGRNIGLTVGAGSCRYRCKCHPNQSMTSPRLFWRAASLALAGEADARPALCQPPFRLVSDTVFTGALGFVESFVGALDKGLPGQRLA